MYEQIKCEIKNLTTQPTLAAILVGNHSSSLRYIEQKRKWAEFVGIKFKLIQLDKTIHEKDLLRVIDQLNTDPHTCGFIIQLPLPKHIQSSNIINRINPHKDVDGFHPENQGKMMIGDPSGFHPCTPEGVMEIFKRNAIEVEGKLVTILGRSNIVGKPLAMMLINAGATVISCNSKTKKIHHYTSQSDIVISAVGKPKFLTLDMIHTETIVIDVGFSVIDGKIYGDADFENIYLAGNTITPVPGGVGPLTVACLMKNTLTAHKRQQSLGK